jgi:hypothetical protein
MIACAIRSSWVSGKKRARARLFARKPAKDLRLANAAWTRAGGGFFVLYWLATKRIITQDYVPVERWPISSIDEVIACRFPFGFTRYSGWLRYASANLVIFMGMLATISFPFWRDAAATTILTPMVTSGAIPSVDPNYLISAPVLVVLIPVLAQHEAGGKYE